MCFASKRNADYRRRFLAALRFAGRLAALRFAGRFAAFLFFAAIVASLPETKIFLFRLLIFYYSLRFRVSKVSSNKVFFLFCFTECVSYNFSVSVRIF